MTNSEITNVMLGDTEASALYMGDRLVWQQNIVFGENTLAGRFTDDSTKADWTGGYGRVKFNARRFHKEMEVSGGDLRSFFSTCYKLEFVDHFPNTSRCTDFSALFNYCDSLKYVDLSSLNTSNAENMEFMFVECSALRAVDLSSFDTSKVTNMYNMFCGDTSLVEINFGNLDLSNVYAADMIFYGCTSLTTVRGTIQGFGNGYDPYLYDSLDEYECPSLDLSDCPLTNSSAMVFINGLAKAKSDQTITFSAQTYDTLTSAQIAVATSKGWSVVRG